MLDSILETTTEVTTAITLQNLIMCTIASLILGLVIAGVHMYKNQYSKNFIVTLALLPAMVQMIIMLVNGNLGTGVAVMGAFSLVRFRSTPGNSREISSIFLAMGVGLATGMGYLAIAALFLLMVGIATILLNTFSFGNHSQTDRELKITIPENLDYNGIFDDLLKKYTSSFTLIKVKTTNMGSMFELQYRIVLKDEGKEKEFIDDLRCRNGNLTIVCGHVASQKDEL